MLHKEFWGLVFLGFVVWIFIVANPSQRIERVCRPFGWTGNVVTSLSALASPDYQEDTQKWFDGLEYGCRFTVWRVIYQDQYNQELQAQKATTPTASAPAAPAASSPAASAPASSAVSAPIRPASAASR